MIKVRFGRGAGTGRETATGLFIGDDTAVAAGDFYQQYEIILKTIPAIRSLIFTEQVHGDRVLDISTDTARLHLAGAGDALFTRMRGVALLIRTADCVPVLFASRNGGLIGAVHAGWRGLEAKILTKAIQATGEKTEALEFVVGPFIGERSYEVGEDVAGRFASGFVQPKSSGKYWLSLRKTLEAEFKALGIMPAQVTWHDHDTFAGNGWYSARRGHTARNLALVWFS